MISSKKLLCLCILIVSCLNSFAQKYTLSGIIKDSIQPIVYSNVILLDEFDEIVIGTITDENGSFSLSAPVGNYTLTISFLGYTTKEQNITLEKDTDLGAIILQPDNTQLNEVVITAEKPLIERKVDRLIFNVGQSVAATGGNAMNALKVTPRIKVQNDKISMIGKGNLMVMINDRIVQLSGEDLSNYLKSLNTEDIQRIEVISNPPAKYSAEGNSGLINIVTKKAASDAWNATLRSSYKQATYAIGGLGSNFNFQKSALQLSTGVNYVNGSSAPVETSQVYYPNLIWRERNNRRDFNDFLSAQIGLEYELNKKLSTGFNYKYVNSQPLIKDDRIIKINNSSSDVLDSIIKTPARSKYETDTHSFNYHLIYEIDTVGKKLSVDFDFFDFNSKTDRVYETQTFYPNNQPTSSSYEKARNVGFQYVKNYSLNIDMEHPMGWASLNYGGKVSFIKTNNLFDAYEYLNNEEVLNQSNQFDYKENTQAFYISFQKKFSGKWETKVGLRMENTQTEGYSKTLNQTNTNNYTKVFPTAYLAYTLNDNNSLNLNYGRRINRPRYFFLNPFRWVSSPYSYSEGNPFLQPAFIDNVELAYSYKDKLTTNFYYSYTDDDFEQLVFLEEGTNIQRTIPKNFIVNKTFGINQSFVFKPIKWWNLYAAADVYYSSTDSKIPVALQYLSGWNGIFNISNDFTLSDQKTLLFNISYYYVTNGVDNLDYNSSTNQLDASIKWFLLDKKMILSLYANDIFSSDRITYTTYSNNIKNSFSNYYDQRYVRFSVVYNFGKSFDTNNRQNKNQEELNRTN